VSDAVNSAAFLTDIHNRNPLWVGAVLRGGYDDWQTAIARPSLRPDAERSTLVTPVLARVTRPTATV